MKDLYSECLKRDRYHLLATIGHNDGNNNENLYDNNYSAKNLSIMDFNNLIQLYGTTLNPIKGETNWRSSNADCREVL